MKNRENWKVFKIASIFDMFTGASISQNKFNVGSIPRITATDMNNGIGLFTERIEDRNFRSFQNFISVSFLGSIFYHNYEASLDMKIHGLKIKDKELNPDLAQFLIVCLKNSLPKASYGNQLSSKDLLTKNILLPVNEYGTPNWAFMEKYVQIKSNQINATYQFPKLHEITDYRELDEVEWRAFTLDSITIITGGRDWEVYNRTSGTSPFIGASSINNGITDFVNIVGREKYTDAGVIGINRNGSVGYAFYHPYKAYFSGDTRFLEVIGYKNNRYVNQFIQTSIMKQKEKYAYGYKMGTERIKRQVVMLPQKDDKPDYNFMEQYMKRMENRILQKMEQ